MLRCVGLCVGPTRARTLAKLDRKYCVYPIRHSWATRALQRSLDPLTEAILGPTRPRSGVSRGLESDATEEERTAALVVAVAEPDEAEVETPVAKRPRLQLPQLRLKRIRAILTGHFACEWSMAKGSERKVYRQGGKQFTFGCHGLDPQVHPVQIKNCLGKLGISLGDFIAACG